MRIVVTGGAGFIGSHIVDAYIAQGHEVFVIDDFSAGDRKHVNAQATVFSLDILDPSIPRIIEEISPAVLSHHAAQTDLRSSVADPLSDARINILGLIRLLEGCKKAGVQRVIYASSGGAVYGEQEAFPAPEGHPTRPASPYGISKLTGEHYLSYYHRAFGLPYIALRYGNVYGPRQLSTGEAGVVAIFARQLLDGGAPTINGDGKQTRDYVYVEDVIAANLLALDSAVTGPVNIGTGRESDVLTIYRLLCEKLGVERKPLHAPPKAGEQRRSSLDPSLARKLLGWVPQTSLSFGLDKTIRYYRQVNNP